MDRQDKLEDEVDAAAGDMEDNVAEMEARAEELREGVKETRGDWERKQDDPQVPGAQAPGEGTDDDAAA
jgi:hypothetical protein